MNRMMAIVERELRKFFRSPTLMLVSMVFPLVQLIILGNAFGGKIKDARLGVVDQDGGTQAVKVLEALNAVQANSRTFRPVYYDSDQQAMEDVRTGRLDGAIIIPPEYSRRVYEQNHPRIALDRRQHRQLHELDAGADLQRSDQGAEYSLTCQPSRILQQVTLDTVELYPYIEYMKYLLPGSIVLAMFVSVMIGGGMLYIDDKARGVHEGYLVTPITKFELVAGLNVAGAIKAILAGVVITVLGSLLAGLGSAFQPQNIILILLLVVTTSVAFNTMMFLMMVRVEDPLVPRATFGILNTLLFFPSGAIYPIKAFPQWLQAIAYVDPFTYAVRRLQGDPAERRRIRGDPRRPALSERSRRW